MIRSVYMLYLIVKFEFFFIFVLLRYLITMLQLFIMALDTLIMSLMEQLKRVPYLHAQAIIFPLVEQRKGL